MPRPKKWRKIEFVPIYEFFKPAGVPKNKLEIINLKVEELEAMRLKDIEGLNQAECAEKMAVSRQTLQLILESARKKVALALTMGKGIHISGGNYTVNICEYECLSCHHTYTMNYEGKVVCPECSSTEVECLNAETFCKKSCYRPKQVK